MPLIAGAALAAVSGVLYGLAFPPTEWRWIAWVALTPLLFALRRERLRQALVLALVWTLSKSWAVADWLPRGVANYYGQPYAVGFALFLGVALFMLAPHYLLFAAVYRGLVRLPNGPPPLLTAAAWVGAELGREKLLTGNAWALLGYSQVGWSPVVQIADVAGVYAVTFAIVAVNAAVVEAASTLAAARPWTSALRRCAGAAAVVAVVVGYGVLRQRQLEAELADRPGIAVAVVQGNVDLGSQWRPDFYGRNLDTYLELTQEALRRRNPALVAWPENAMSFFLDDESEYRGRIGSLLSENGAQLIAGGPRFVGLRDPEYFNSAFLVEPGGVVRGVYDKQWLLPFGEYFPFASIDFLRRRFGRIRNFSFGSDSPPLPSAAGPAGVLICNEVFFPEIAAERVRQGARLLLNLSNDTWLSEAKYSEIAFAKATLRAVEQRRYLIRSSTSGPSAIIDPLGRAAGKTGLLVRAVVGGTVRPIDQVTIYNRVGDLFAYACLIAAAVMALRGALRGGSSS